GRQTHDEKPRAARAERGHRCVEPVGFAATPFPPEGLQPRTKRAIPSWFAGALLRGAFSPRNRRRHRRLRRRRPAAAPWAAAETAAYGARAARALLAPRARRDHRRSSAAAGRLRGERRLARAAPRGPIASSWVRGRPGRCKASTKERK